MKRVIPLALACLFLSLVIASPVLARGKGGGGGKGSGGGGGRSIRSFSGGHSPSFKIAGHHGHHHHHGHHGHHHHGHHHHGHHHGHHHHGHHHHGYHHHGHRWPVFRPLPVPVAVPVSVPVAPAPLAVAEPVIVELGAGPAESPPVIVSGMSYALNSPAGANLGTLPGQVLIKLNGVGLRSVVLQWQPQSAQFTAPRIDLTDTIPATMALVRADGSVISEIPILFAPPQTAAPATSPATLAQAVSGP